MNVRLLALATIVASTAGVACIEPARAENPQSAARFKYADNLWSMEKPRTPGSRYLPTDNHAVRQGSVSPSVLGLDKSFLSKPEPVPQPIARPQVAANPFSMVTTPKVLPTPSPKALKATPYNSQFGKPQEAPPVVAHQPEPMQATPEKFPQETQSSVSGKLVPPRTRVHHSRAVAGRLAKPAQPIAVARAPIKPIANYGGTNHYSPGSFVNGFSHKSVGSVHGEILNR